MESLPAETLISLLMLLDVHDLSSFSRTCHYYSSIASDDRLWKSIFLKEYRSYKVSPLGTQLTPNKGWRKEYKNKTIIKLSQKLVSTVKSGNEKLALEIISITSSLSYNQSFVDSAQAAIKYDHPYILEKILQHWMSNPNLAYSLRNTLLKLITLACVDNKLNCLKVLLENGVDISNSGVLLMGKKKGFSLNGPIDISPVIFSRVANFSLESSYLFLDTLFSQITLFLCAQTGNESVLNEMIQTKRGHILIHKRTGIWDYGNEVLTMTSNCNRLYTMAADKHGLITASGTHLPNKLHSQKEHLLNHQLSISTNGKLEGNDGVKNIIEEYKKMLKVRSSQYKMIEKRLSILTKSWSHEWSSFSALHWAAHGGHESTIRLLIKHGIDLDARTSYNRTALDIAKEKGHKNCIELLEKSFVKKIELKDFDKLKKLIIEGKSSNAVLKELNNILFERDIVSLDRNIIANIQACAIQYNQPKILANLYLVFSGNTAGCKFSDSDGNTPIHVAAALGQISCLQITVNCGYVNKLNRSMQTPLVIAIINRKYHMVQPLLDMGANTCIKSYHGSNALHLSVTHPQTVQILLTQTSIDIAERDQRGRTALHLAASKGCFETVQLLLDHAEQEDQNYVDLQDENGNTALHLAITNSNESNRDGRLSTVNLLIQYGADISLKNHQSKLDAVEICVLLKQEDTVLLDLLVANKPPQHQHIPTKLDIFASSRSPFTKRRIMEMFVEQKGLSLDILDDPFYQHFMKTNRVVGYYHQLQLKNLTNILLTNVKNITTEFLLNILLIMEELNYQTSHISAVYIINNYLTLRRYDLVYIILLNLNTFTHTTLIPETVLQSVILESRETLQHLKENGFLRQLVTLIQFNLENEKISEYDSDIIFSEILEQGSLSNQPSVETFMMFIKKGSFKCLEVFCKRYLKYLGGESSSLNELQLEDKELNALVSSLPKHKKEIKEILKSYFIPKEYKDKLNRGAGLYTGNGEWQISVGIINDEGIHKQTSTEQPLGNQQQQQHCTIEELYKKQPTEKCNDCGLMVRESDQQDHLMACINRLIPCPNSHSGLCSSTKIPREKVSNHLQHECQYLHCYQCDQYFTRDQFQTHIFTHDTEIWENCSLCNQVLSGFKSSYTDQIVHIRDYPTPTSTINKNNNNIHYHHNNNNNNSKLIPLQSKEYQHIGKECPNHFVRCISCKCTIHKSNLPNHKCLLTHEYELPSYDPTLYAFN